MDSSEHFSANTSSILDPPKDVAGALRYIGPGLILSAAIVGSGELIATTTLGAQAGFALLWVVLLGCCVKVAVQLEYGRFCISHGLTTFQAWNHVGSAKLYGIHWTVGIGAFYMLATMVGQAGVLGGASQVVNHAWPAVPLWVWLMINVVAIGLLLSHGRYGPVEKVSTAFNLVFVLTVLYCVLAIQRTSYAFSIADLTGGFTFRLPKEFLGLAVAAFGITGVAAGEIAIYPYWCIEKGYARWTGPKEDSPQWYQRARGWTRVMMVDALVSMCVYTVATGGFYILGASVLRAQRELEDGSEFIQQLSSMFTDVLGNQTHIIFMMCAFTVLFSTVFANSAGFSRLWADFFGLCRWIDWQNEKQRARWIAVVAWVFPTLCAVIYFVVQKPLLLVTFMGVCNALFLIVVAYQTVIFRYRHTDRQLQPSWRYDTALWISLAAIGLMAARSLHILVRSSR